MSAITIDDELVHYEVLGRGKPILLIHGWLGSWRYWVPTMQQLAMKYRCYALDLWGFGDTGKDPRRYDFDSQVNLIDRFIERMGIPKVVIIGHGLGALLGARYAVLPESAPKVHKLLAVAPPLIDMAPPAGSYTGDDLDDDELPHAAMTIPNRKALGDLAARQQQWAAQQNNDVAIPSPAPNTAKQPHGNNVRTNVLHELFRDNPLDSLLNRAINPESVDFDKLLGEISKAHPPAIYASVENYINTSAAPDLMRTKAPLCVVLGDEDELMPRPEESVLQKISDRDQTKLLVMSETRHFPMLEDKSQFARLLRDFLEATDVSILEMKDEWRRRKR
ncbi:MAG: alpha/beta fold hydrolase [Anaerolineales bacterium]